MNTSRQTEVLNMASNLVTDTFKETLGITYDRVQPGTKADLNAMSVSIHSFLLLSAYVIIGTRITARATQKFTP
jgi:hypothetical protein